MDKVREEFERLIKDKCPGADLILNDFGDYLYISYRDMFIGYQMLQPEIDGLKAVINIKQDECDSYRTENTALQAENERLHKHITALSRAAKKLIDRWDEGLNERIDTEVENLRMAMKETK